MQKLTRKLRSVVFAIVLVVLPAEILCRIATAAFLQDYTGAAIREAMDAPPVDESEGRGEGGPAKETIHPYVGYVTTPDLGLAEKAYPVTQGRLAQQIGRGASPWWLDLRANNWGFWSPYDFPYERKSDEFVVAVLGGSVAMWLGLQGRDTLEQELGRRLHDREVVLLNFALGGFKQPQQAMLLSYALTHGMKLDAVINIDGFNEAAIGYQNGIHATSPDFPRTDLWSTLVTGIEHSNRVLELQAEVSGLRARAARDAKRAASWSRYSNIVGILWMLRARTAQSDVQLALAGLYTAIDEDLPAYREFAARGPRRDVQGPERDDLIVDLWVEGSINLASLCAGRGIPYVHVLQPTLHDTNPRPSKPLSREERRLEANLAGNWGVWREGVRRFYPVFRARAGELHDAGVAFADLSYLFESTSETIYYDICHYNQRGNEVLAGELATLVAAEAVP